MKVVVLTSETPANVWLVNQLLARHDIAGIVIERRPLAQTSGDKTERRRRMVQRYGLVRTLNKLLFNWYRARFLAAHDARAIKEAVFPDGAPVAYSREVPTIVVGNINAPECIAFIGGLAPDVLAVCGTTVLKPDVFTLAPRGTINIHTGITPEYRSAEPIFWALYHGEPEKVGVTIHYIDRGIDTGPVIHQESVPVYAEDSLATIYIRCLWRGADLYSRALTDCAAGTVTTKTRVDAVSRAFLSIDQGLAQYVVFRWRFWRLAGRLPDSGAGATSDVREAQR